ncbi:Clp protease N-terminal domain-containing protein [Actinophytocola sp.]|uniref:Clp protease N-terminal domain-containing protein n=1 Tax=Actinophytocola sp. TaxID=1872138 RepID=UPI002D6802DE|nr:Clp protease N-terminal domain-containing protein [Actinophytocola sp.]HYQ64119.1 Clp protease N-terminal domain-containing protein [Actinophytocola sp.]
MNSFDSYLHNTIMRAHQEARDDGSPTVEVQHLLLAVAAEPEPTVRPLLASAGLDRDAVRRALEQEFVQSLSAVGVSSNAHPLPEPSRLPAKPAMGTSAKLALDRGFSAVTRKKDLRPAHVLLGILAAQAGIVPRALAIAGADQEDLAARVRRALTEQE